MGMDPELEEEEIGETVNVNSLELKDFNICEATKATLNKRGVKALFPVQAACFNAISEGRDVIGKDRTGTGKTLAYALPILEKLRTHDMLKKTRGQAPFKIVLVPTRELANQVGDEYLSLQNGPSEFRVAKIYGGAPLGNQIISLREGVEVVVGTPGRVMDLLEKERLDLGELRTVVLDETDRMLDMGFQKDIEKILGIITQHMTHKGRTITEIQFLLFSATIPKFVTGVARNFMASGFAFIDMIGNQDIKTSKTVRHISVPYTSNDNRWDVLSRIIKTFVPSKDQQYIIFTETKHECTQIKEFLRSNISVLNGDVAQERREIVMKEFRAGQIQCIVATNVLARGVDFKGVDLIIQTSIPTDTESYIHRSGRAGRAGCSGISVIMYPSVDINYLQQIERKAKIRFERLEISSLKGGSPNQNPTHQGENSSWNPSGNTGNETDFANPFKTQDVSPEPAGWGVSSSSNQQPIVTREEPPSSWGPPQASVQPEPVKTQTEISAWGPPQQLPSNTPANPESPKETNKEIKAAPANQSSGNKAQNEGSSADSTTFDSLFLVNLPEGTIKEQLKSFLNEKGFNPTIVDILDGKSKAKLVFATHEEKDRFETEATNLEFSGVSLGIMKDL